MRTLSGEEYALYPHLNGKAFPIGLWQKRQWGSSISLAQHVKGEAHPCPSLNLKKSTPLLLDIERESGSTERVFHQARI